MFGVRCLSVTSGLEVDYLMTTAHGRPHTIHIVISLRITKSQDQYYVCCNEYSMHRHVDPLPFYSILSLHPFR